MNARWVESIADRVVDWRRILLTIFALLTVVFSATATRLGADAGFTKMIPLDHPFMQVFLKYQSVFGGANRVLLALHPRDGDIYQTETMLLLRQITDEVFHIPGVERSSVTSLFTPNVRYTEVVEDGFRGGNIVSADFNGSAQQLREVRANVARSEWQGRIVGRDGSVAMVVATLQDIDPVSGGRVDLRAIARQFEEIRSRHEDSRHSIHIIGFAKAVGDIAAGAVGVLVFFGLAFLMTTVLLWRHTRSASLTGYALGCALVPVIWLLGLMPLVGLGLDPMSILVPFLIFAIAVSHAVQMTQAWQQAVGRGQSPSDAARSAFVQLFVPGAMALLANALGFLVIAFVPIEVVRELALTATLGVSLMIITNKLMLPALLSMRVGVRAAPSGSPRMDRVWRFAASMVRPRRAAAVCLIWLAVLVAGAWGARGLQIGDLGRGVPELRPDSRYNQDTEFITDRFAIGVDVLQVVVEASGREAPCVDPRVMEPMGEFELRMRQNPGVAAVSGLAGFIGAVAQAYAETNVRWRALPSDEAQMAQGTSAATRLGNTFMNPGCTAMVVSIFTRDHQASTIASVVSDVESFAREFSRPDLRFLIGVGNLAVMAATNQVVAAADRWVNLALFGAVTLLCLATFRSFRITACIVIPLAIVTVLCNAVMAWLGIGVKVNTLPVVALGVGVGVDYGIYLFERIRHAMASGAGLEESVCNALRQRGTASLFTALTLSVSVLTWLGSELQFQSDMGLLLAFMFMVNLLGALTLLPAMAAVLLGRSRGRSVAEAVTVDRVRQG
jgi:predicted RND superfamily exporter protein